MKTKIMMLAVALFFITACGENNGNNNQGTHVHEDGTTHENHAHETKKPSTQECFKVDADTTILESEHQHNHDHDHGHDHSHQH